MEWMLTDASSLLQEATPTRILGQNLEGAIGTVNANVNVSVEAADSNSTMTMLIHRL